MSAPRPTILPRDLEAAVQKEAARRAPPLSPAERMVLDALRVLRWQPRTEVPFAGEPVTAEEYSLLVAFRALAAEQRP